MHYWVQERQVLRVPPHILKENREYEEIMNYMGLIVYNGIMYTTVKINIKWQIFL